MHIQDHGGTSHSTCRFMPLKPPRRPTRNQDLSTSPTISASPSPGASCISIHSCMEGVHHENGITTLWRVYGCVHASRQLPRLPITTHKRLTHKLKGSTERSVTCICWSCPVRSPIISLPGALETYWRICAHR